MLQRRLGTLAVGAMSSAPVSFSFLLPASVLTSRTAGATLDGGAQWTTAAPALEAAQIGRTPPRGGRIGATVRLIESDGLSVE
jgi:hypothetical protein